MEAYLRRRRVPESLRLLCRKNMQNAFERGDGNDEALLDKLPRSLRGNVLRQINSRVLRRAPIFFRCDRALVGALCSVLRVCACARRVTSLPSRAFRARRTTS